MKKICWILTWFVAWEIVALFYKDDKFKKTFLKAQGTEKFAVLWQWLVRLNKSVFFDVKNFDYEGSLQDFKKMFDKEKKNIEKKIDEIKWNIGKMNKDQLMPMIEDLQEKLYDLKDKALDMIDDIKERYEIDEKIESFLKSVKDLKAKL